MMPRFKFYHHSAQPEETKDVSGTILSIIRVGQEESSHLLCGILLVHFDQFGRALLRLPKISFRHLPEMPLPFLFFSAVVLGVILTPSFSL
jgi:hypothetical protein